VVNHGSSGSTNRDNPKSVSFTSGPEAHVPAAFKSLVNRISEKRVNYRPGVRGDQEPTLEFDVAMDQGNTVHPPDSLTQFAPNLSQEGLVELSILLIRIEKIKQLGSVNMLQHEAVVRGCRKRMHEGHDVGVADVLKDGRGWNSVSGSADGQRHTLRTSTSLMKLTLVLSSMARSVSLIATSRPPDSLASGRSNPLLMGDGLGKRVSPFIFQGFVPETLERSVERRLLLRLTMPSLEADLNLFIEALRESTSCSNVPDTSQASQTLLNDPWPRVRRRVSETEEPFSHAEMIDPGCNAAV
jgi:hypothetical protein